MNINSEKLLNRLSKVIFVLYIVVLIWIVIFKCNLIGSLESTYIFFEGFTLKERFMYFLIPFQDYFEGPFVNTKDITFADDMLNVLIFIPFGLYLSYFLKKSKLGKVLLISLALSLIFEMFQLFTMIGCYSTKDLITNSLGGIIGYFVYKLIYKENDLKRITVLNICSIIALFIFIPLVIYACINTVKHFSFYVEILYRKL